MKRITKGAVTALMAETETMAADTVKPKLKRGEAVSGADMAGEIGRILGELASSAEGQPELMKLAVSAYVKVLEDPLSILSVITFSMAMGYRLAAIVAEREEREDDTLVDGTLVVGSNGVN